MYGCPKIFPFLIVQILQEIDAMAGYPSLEFSIGNCTQHLSYKQTIGIILLMTLEALLSAFPVWSILIYNYRTITFYNKQKRLSYCTDEMCVVKFLWESRQHIRYWACSRPHAPAVCRSSQANRICMYTQVNNNYKNE